MTGSVTVTTIVQEDNSHAGYLSYKGTGLTLTGVKYSFAEEQHGWLFGGQDDTSLMFYDYEKLTRMGDASTILRGDDFYMRFFFTVPLGGAGVPDPSSLNTGIFGFDCR